MKNKVKDIIACPECGSTDLAKASKVVRARQYVQRYRCKICLRLFTPQPNQTLKA